MAASDQSAGDTGRSLVYELASATMDWMARGPPQQRPDVSDEVWAYSLGTFVDGVPVTPLGYDVSYQFNPATTGGDHAGG